MFESDESERGQESDPARATPPIGEDAEKEQTQHPAPDDDVGVPSDEQIAKEEREASQEPGSGD
jgi:hypothetical protein